MRLNKDRGASLVEYALLVALLVVVCIASIQYLGNASRDGFNRRACAISNPEAPACPTTTTVN